MQRFGICEGVQGITAHISCNARPSRNAFVSQRVSLDTVGLLVLVERETNRKNFMVSRGLVLQCCLFSMLPVVNAQCCPDKSFWITGQSLLGRPEGTLLVETHRVCQYCCWQAATGVFSSLHRLATSACSPWFALSSTLPVLIPTLADHHVDGEVK